MSKHNRSAIEGAKTTRSLYLKEPSLGLLLSLLYYFEGNEALQLGTAGVSPSWLREQAERWVPHEQEIVYYGLESLRALFNLRRRLERLGVACDGWVISVKLLQALIAVRARYDYYDRIVSEVSPYYGWCVMELWLDGYLPDLVCVDGAEGREIIIAYSVHYIRRELWEAFHGGSFSPADVLGWISRRLPAMDADTRASFARAGLPMDETTLSHREEVYRQRQYWRWFSGQDPQRGQLCFHLTFVFTAVYADRTVKPEELGTSHRALHTTAQAWIDARVAEIRAGNYEGLSDLTRFLYYSQMEHSAFGLTLEQVQCWEEAEAQLEWQQALDGDAEAAFSVAAHCTTPPYDFATTTGLPEAEARAIIQEVIDRYIGGLRMRIEAPASPEEAKKLFAELRHFLDYVSDCNRHSLDLCAVLIVDVSHWEMSPRARRSYERRYISTA